jgi:hypothetical protein
VDAESFSRSFAKANRPTRAAVRCKTYRDSGRSRNKKKWIPEFLLTRRSEIPIVRPPFGKSSDFLEQIPSKFLVFPKVDPRPVLSTSQKDSTTGNHCRSLTRQRTSDPFERKFEMKRLSLLLVAFAFLTTASGCCCGLFHGPCGGCNSCGYAPPPCGGCGSCGGYAPAYPMAPACPTCPNGGCGVQAPLMQQGAFYEGDSMYRASVTSAAPIGAPTLAATDKLPTF